MAQYNQRDAEQYIKHLIKHYGIKVVKTSTSSSGSAWYLTKEIKIPKPINIDRFGVCLHEIKHIIDGNIRPNYVAEFRCDKYALDTLLGFEYDVLDWQRRMNWYCLYHIAKDYNKGKFVYEFMPQEIKNHFSEIDFKQWKGRLSVRFSSDPEKSGYDLIFKQKITQVFVATKLKTIGLELWKTEQGLIVQNEGIGYGKVFRNLDQIARYYCLKEN